jgi:hypothetical protein
VERLLGNLFGHPFSKFYSCHLTLVMLEFEFIETIPLAERGPVGPREECVR